MIPEVSNLQSRPFQVDDFSLFEIAPASTSWTFNNSETQFIVLEQVKFRKPSTFTNLTSLIPSIAQNDSLGWREKISI